MVRPRHIAIVMDGNGRWAKARLLPRAAGHRQGVEATQRIVQHCAKLGIEALTLFAFSSENWKRPPTEVKMLIELFCSTLRKEIRRLLDNDVQIRFLGNVSAFPQALREEIAVAGAQTAANAGLKLNIAVNYGGRWDITQAAQALASEAAAGRLKPEDISPDLLAERLST